MKKNFWEIVIYYVVGLIYPIAYFLLMSEYFHRSVFDGAISILTIYILICYVLYPFSSKIVSDKTADKKSSIFLDSKSVLFFAYLFGPFIMLKSKNKTKNKDKK